MKPLNKSEIAPEQQEVNVLLEALPPSVKARISYELKLGDLDYQSRFLEYITMASLGMKAQVTLGSHHPAYERAQKLMDEAAENEDRSISDLSIFKNKSLKDLSQKINDLLINSLTFSPNLSLEESTEWLQEQLSALGLNESTENHLLTALQAKLEDHEVGVSQNPIAEAEAQRLVRKIDGAGANEKVFAGACEKLLELRKSRGKIGITLTK